MCGSARRSWASGIIPNNQGDAGRQPRLQPRHVARAQGDAACGRRQVLLGDVEKNSASAPQNAWAVVVVEHADEVVKAVPTPQLLVAQLRRTTQRAIVKE